MAKKNFKKDADKQSLSDLAIKPNRFVPKEMETAGEKTMGIDWIAFAGVQFDGVQFDGDSVMKIDYIVPSFKEQKKRLAEYTFDDETYEYSDSLKAQLRRYSGKQYSQGYRQIPSSPRLNRPAENWREFLSQVTYKPGVRFQYQDSGRVERCYVSAEVRDVDPPHYPTSLHINFELPPWGLLDENAMIRLLVTYIDDMEMHEAHEWFQVRGERVYNPHRNAPGMQLPDYKVLS